MAMDNMVTDNRLLGSASTRAPEAKPEDTRGIWRIIGLMAGAAATAFWIYTFYAISQVPVGDGSGFQWLAEVPLTMIYLFVTVPALVLSFFRKTAQIGGILGVVGLVLFALLWAQLLQELRFG